MSKLKISVCIPTYLDNVDDQLSDVYNTTDIDVEVFASCKKGSAAYNRNYCLDKATGDIIVMIDDDITGLYDGWVEDLIKPLEDESVSIVSARLLNPDGSYGGMMYDNFIYENGYYKPRENFVPSACIAFRKTSIRFDEGYVTAGFEDTDFCKQMEQAYPEKKVVINNNCKVIHKNEMKYGGKENLKLNKERYLKKWGRVHKRGNK